MSPHETLDVTSKYRYILPQLIIMHPRKMCYYFLKGRKQRTSHQNGCWSPPQGSNLCYQLHWSQWREILTRHFDYSLAHSMISPHTNDNTLLSSKKNTFKGRTLKPLKRNVYKAGEKIWLHNQLRVHTPRTTLSPKPRSAKRVDLCRNTWTEKKSLCAIQNNAASHGAFPRKSLPGAFCLRHTLVKWGNEK